MLSKQVKIPKFLHELHGETAPVYNLVCVYLTGLVIAILFSLKLIELKTPAWKIILSAFLWFDIAGGVVANLSTPTNQYYKGKTKSRFVFLAIHFFQPGIFAVLFFDNIIFFVFVYIFTMASCMIVNVLRNCELQQVIAGGLTTLGITLSLILFHLTIPVLYLLAPLFMIKLILGFSVQRPIFQTKLP
jgi:hypothetical protein